MRILYHHRTQGRGVEGVHVREFAGALVALGNTVDILSPSGLNTSSSSTTGSNRMHAFISKFTPELIFELIEILYNVVSGKKLSALLKTKKYDLLYERYAIFNWSGIKMAHKYHMPIILEVNYTSFMPLYRKRSMLLKPLAHWVDKKIFTSAKGIVVVSNALKKHLVDLGVDEKKITVCTNAADPDKFNPGISGEKIRIEHGLQQRKIIGFIGGFYPWHGLDMLIDAFSAIRIAIPNAFLVLIGDGPRKEAIRKKIEDLGLTKEVLFFGQVPHQHLPEYISAFDVAVMPDSNDYGSPMKIYEYMAMGKPVIAPRLGPLEDGIEDGKQGILFSQHNQEELTIALQKLCSDDTLRLKMGEAARKNILDNHSWLKNAEATLRLLCNPNIRNGRQKTKILFLTPRIPFPPIKGDRIRPYYFIKELSRSCNVDLCTFYENHDDLDGIKEMGKYCQKIETVFLPRIRSYLNILLTLFNLKPLQVNYYFSFKMKRKLKEILQREQYDIIHVVLDRMMPYAKIANSNIIVLDHIDALSLNMLRRASAERNIFKKVVFNFEYLLIKRFEENTQCLYNTSLVTSEIDKNFLPDKNTIIIPNGVDTDYFTSQSKDKDIDLIFTGNMGYFPNVEAALYLAQEILPRLQKRCPQIKIYIVGANPSRKIRALSSNKNITVTGFVDDIRVYLNRAKVFVAPLRSGSGIQNKILEAMACGLPVVTTSYGNAGIKARDNECLVVADSADLFTDKIIALLSSEILGSAIGSKARRYMEEEFSWSSKVKKLEEIYNHMLSIN
jgi:polysaccharide biosynthesis protein PslH